MHTEPQKHWNGPAVIHALKWPRSHLVEILGADRETIRTFLLAQDDGTLVHPRITESGAGADYAPAGSAALAADGFLWRSETLRCAMLRAVPTDNVQVRFNSQYVDILHCWWSDQPFEVRDVGSGRFITFASDECSIPRFKEFGGLVHGNMPVLHPAERQEGRYVSTTNADWLLYPPVAASPIVIAGQYEDVCYLHWWWSRRVDFHPSQSSDARLAPLEWFPRELEEVWRRVSKEP